MNNGSIALPLAHARQRELLEQAARAHVPGQPRRRLAANRDAERARRPRLAVLRIAGGAGKGSVGA